MLRTALGPDVQVRSEFGCTYEADPNPNPDNHHKGDSQLLCPYYNTSAVAAALDGADVAIVFVGTGAAIGENHDIMNLTLWGHQQQLVEDAIAAKPTMGVVLVVLSGAPLNITKYVAGGDVKAIIQAGYPQNFGGHAVIDAILGKFSPSGRLPYTWPYADTVTEGGPDKSGPGGLNNYTMLGSNVTYRYGQPDPLFPFAFGLSYTSFAFSNLVATASITPCESIHVTVTIKNTGRRDGADVAQIYIKWLSAAQKTPVVQLVNFEKVFLSAGEEQTVAMTIDPRHMALLEVPPAVSGDDDANWTPPTWWVKPGQIELRVGDSQPAFGSTLSQTVTITGSPTAVTSC